MRAMTSEVIERPRRPSYHCASLIDGSTTFTASARQPMHLRQLIELLAGTLALGAVDGPAGRAAARLGAMARTNGARVPTLDLRAWLNDTGDIQS